MKISRYFVTEELLLLLMNNTNMVLQRRVIHEVLMADRTHVISFTRVRFDVLTQIIFHIKLLRTSGAFEFTFVQVSINVKLCNKV